MHVEGGAYFRNSAYTHIADYTIIPRSQKKPFPLPLPLCLTRACVVQVPDKLSSLIKLKTTHLNQLGTSHSFLPCFGNIRLT